MPLPPDTTDPVSATTKNPTQIRRMFGAIAGKYDFLNHFLSLGIDRSWRRRTAGLVKPSSGGPILDVCSGTADLALEYARAGGRNISVVGTDFCREMLNIASLKCRSRSEGNRIQLVESDACRLPFRDGAFEIVCVAFGLRNVGDTQKGLNEMVRVCQAGGRVAILEFSMPQGKVAGRLYAWYFRSLLPLVGQLLTGSPQKAYHYLPESVLGFPQGEDLMKRMRGAGLRDVFIKRFTFGIATLYVGTK